MRCLWAIGGAKGEPKGLETIIFYRIIRVGYPVLGLHLDVNEASLHQRFTKRVDAEVLLCMARHGPIHGGGTIGGHVGAYKQAARLQQHGDALDEVPGPLQRTQQVDHAAGVDGLHAAAVRVEPPAGMGWAEHGRVKQVADDKGAWEAGLVVEEVVAAVDIMGGDVSADQVGAWVSVPQQVAKVRSYEIPCSEIISRSAYRKPGGVVFQGKDHGNVH